MSNLNVQDCDSLFNELPQEISQGVSLIKAANNWQEKYRQLMLLGKYLTPVPLALRQESAQVKGCESQAWLYHHQQLGQHFYLADSEARIVKGLIALLLAATQGQTTAYIHAFDLEQYFNDLGLSGQLSPSRTNGLTALANEIKALAT
ncbi:SufE family protein [Shewanella sp.]|uniref:SufE family protein n=1 Tax=Shewanella sp. TaxID=50422 RepID=UPI0040537C35